MTLLSVIQEFGRTFKIAYPNPLWLAFSLFLIGLLGLTLILFGFPAAPIQREPFYFLLSTLAGTLGTVLVLAFSFTLVAAQIATRYSQILFHRVLDLWALWYAVPFVVGILLPLFLLHGHFFLWSVQVSLLIGAFCIVSLLPFAVAVRRLLLISEVILENEKRLLDAKSDQDVQALTKQLANISVGALALKDYETFEFGVQRLKDSAITTCGRIELGSHVGREIRGMLFRNADDLYASDILLKAMLELASKQIAGTDSSTREEMLDELADSYRSVNISALRHYDSEVKLIGQLAGFAVAECQSAVVGKFQTILHIIGERAISECSIESESASSAIATLGDMIQIEMKSSLPANDHDRLVRSAVMQIEFLGTTARAANKADIGDLALVQLRRAINTHSNGSERVKRNIEAAIARLDE